MEPQQPSAQPSQPSRPSHPQLHTMVPPPPSSIPSRTANSTPASSPGLFSPTNPRANLSLPIQPLSEGTTPTAGLDSPYLHPLQGHKVRETHKANVDTDFTTGRKLINHYEIIDELGRGMHGKVKLARNLETGENVAIKIIPRFSKKRRLGKVTAMSTQDKSKREIAILKKIRHPNVVALLEIIDDPELKKIYMVLEHVELGEIVWRKKGLPHICTHERRRVEREMRGEQPTPEEERYEKLMEQRQVLKDLKRAKIAQRQGPSDFWSLEHGPVDDEEAIALSRSLGRDAEAMPFPSSASASKVTSRAPSRTHSAKSLNRSGTPHPSEPELPPIPADDELVTTGSFPAASALDGTMYGPYAEDLGFRGRSPSMADSIISHMSSIDYNRVHDPFADDFSYVPCFTLESARRTFRGTVLGLEYLHYQGVVHRDIKPANLLCTKDHRVKISDFGVSYFGRPIRDGEPDDTVSESEARDFDDDLELAKTVGTPAFFAPELCYTDDRAGLQPKVSEQIDVWSLGVTLYCLIFARIPFLAEDEWQMFKKIATEDVYIPTRRLRPVDPSTKPDENSLYTRVNVDPYRDDDELAYEDIDWQLHDLLSKMLIKNPEKRIRLRDVKRHPWVTHGLPNVISWLEETDPKARTSGKKIQVDEKEMAHAVVPLNFVERTLERTKSTFSGVKKTIGKIMNARGERAESASRRRAASSATSSVGDRLSNLGVAGTPQPREGRRKSLRGDVDYFATLTDVQPYSEHPLTHSVAASPHQSPREESPASAVQQSAVSVGGEPTRHVLELATDFNVRDLPAERQTSTAAPQKPATRHAHARSVTNAFLTLTPSLRESQTVPPSPAHFDGPYADPSSALRKARDMRPPVEDGFRARSVDRGLFSSTDKRAEAMVSLSIATAPGNVQVPLRAPSLRSSELARAVESVLQPSPLSASVPRVLAGYQHGQPKSDPNMQAKRQTIVELEERPMTAHRIHDLPDAKTPPMRVYNNSTPESFSRAQQHMLRRQLLEHEEEIKRQELQNAVPPLDPAFVPCPPSPDDELFARHPPPPSREDTMGTNVSSSSTSMGAMITPLTSPSLTTSPTCASTTVAKDAAEEMLAFQSDPSLPALLSSTSSVSADPEGDFLGNPGIVGQPRSVIDTSDSLTPPALSKEPMAGFPLEAEEHMMHEHSIGGVILPMALDGRPISSAAPPSSNASVRTVEEDDDSDSDDGLVMGSSKRKSHIKDRASFGKFSARRRDTNASVASTDTAKKLVVDHE
ncbi:kinase-like protein [Thozetella sp. PMI_491]|nr:kinase-like protein [Thozetella sp. PMI_491]